MAEYFLPDVTVLTGGESGSHEPWVGVSGTIYEIRLLESRDFQNLYLPQWSNALCGGNWMCWVSARTGKTG